jgi:hypothetical protein
MHAMVESSIMSAVLLTWEQAGRRFSKPLLSRWP